MKLTRPIAVAATALALTTAPAQPAETEGARVLRTIQHFATQYALMLTRSFVDLTYDNLSIEPGTNDLILSGLTFYPVLDWDSEAACQITLDRAVIADFNDLNAVQMTIELSGLSVPNACFDPTVGGTLMGVGYNGLTSDQMLIEVSYDLPSASADITMQGSVVDAGNISLSAAFNYLWFRVDPDGRGDPKPAAWLREAELSFDNAGLWEVVEPMIAAQFGDVNALPQMAQLMIGQAFTEGGTRTPTAEESAFVENLSAELARFIAEKNRIVVTAAPKEGVWLDEATFDGGPSALIARLQPKISAVPLAYRGMILPELLDTALSGGSLDDADRLRVGEALITGIGAPRAVEAGKTLLAPLAEAWNGAASLLVSEVLSDAGDLSGAYAMGLRALAAGERGAASHADALEAKMTTAEVLSLQSAAMQTWPGSGDTTDMIDAMITAGDVAGLRRMSHAASLGKDRPRDYQTAYFLSSLAAAAGDKGAASLRDRLDQRFGGAADPAWGAVSATAAKMALDNWTRTMAAKIAERVR